MRATLLQRWGMPAVAGLAALLANGLVPGLAISLYAAATADAARISAFANAVAEPFALAGSVLATAAIAAWSAPGHPIVWQWGARLGLVAAAFVAAGSAWAGDADAWTVAAVVLLPVTGVVAAAARRVRRVRRTVDAPVTLHAFRTALMASEPIEISAAFDDAIRQVDRAHRADLHAANGRSARPQLERLRADLEAERARALDRRAPDPEWLRRTVRWVTEWTPESEIALLAALGRIARAGARPPAD